MECFGSDNPECRSLLWDIRSNVEVPWPGSPGSPVAWCLPGSPIFQNYDVTMKCSKQIVGCSKSIVRVRNRSSAAVFGDLEKSGDCANPSVHFAKARHGQSCADIPVHTWVCKSLAQITDSKNPPIPPMPPMEIGRAHV